jgi:hypothetical protein
MRYATESMDELRGETFVQGTQNRNSVGDVSRPASTSAICKIVTIADMQQEVFYHLELYPGAIRMKISTVGGIILLSEGKRGKM